MNRERGPRCVATAWAAALVGGLFAACQAEPDGQPVAPPEPPPANGHDGVVPVEGRPIAVVQAVPVPAVVRPTDGEREAVTRLLRQLAAEHRSSRLSLGGADARTATRDLRQMGAVAPAVLGELLADERPVLLELGGPFFAILVRDLGARALLCPKVVDGLRSETPRWRAFACEALGYLEWRDAAPHLRAALTDTAAVAGYSDGSNVATFARRALELLGEH